MKLQKKILYSILIALVFLFSSMFVKIIPCQTAPVIPNPVYKWGFCNLNPDSASQLGISRRYFGYSTSLTESYLIFLAILVVVMMIIFHFISRSSRD